MSAPVQAARVSLRDIAQKLALSHSTVSRALRNRPRVSHELREKIQQAALEMGYRPDPMLSALAQYRQGKGSMEIGSAIGWLNHWPVPRELRKHKEFDAYWRGALKAAEKFGYRLEEFLCNEQIPMRRLEKILRTRNINGVLIPPHPSLTDWSEFHWEDYCVVRFGRSLTRPQLHLVTSDQTSNAILAFEKIRARGYRRIGYLTGRRMQQEGIFAAGFFKAGFLLAQSEAQDDLPPLPPLELQEAGNGADERRLKQWMHDHRPDAILTDVAAAGELVAAAGYRVPDDVGLAVLSILDGNADAGINQNSEEIGRVAVLLAVSLINDGARGIPSIFRQILIAGEWVDGKSLPVR